MSFKTINIYLSRFPRNKIQYQIFSIKDQRKSHEWIWNLSLQVLMKNPEHFPEVQQDWVKLVLPQSTPPGCLWQQVENDSRSFRPLKVEPCWLFCWEYCWLYWDGCWAWFPPNSPLNSPPVDDCCCCCCWGWPPPNSPSSSPPPFEGCCFWPENMSISPPSPPDPDGCWFPPEPNNDPRPLPDPDEPAPLNAAKVSKNSCSGCSEDLPVLKH